MDIVEHGMVVMPRIRQFEEHLKSLNGVFTGEGLFEMALKFDLLPPQAREVVNRLINNGDLNQVPDKPVLHDDLGVYAEDSPYKFYTLAPEHDQAISLAILSGKQLEEYEQRWLHSFLSKEKTVVDVGANIGSWTMLCARNAKAVYAFEPDPRNFIVLQKNIVTRNAKHVRAYAAACGDKSGSVFLNINPRNSGDHRCWESDPNRGKLCVPMVTLDEFLRNEPVDILKVDTQGYEVKVLQGAKNILARGNPMIMFLEFWPLGLRGAGNTPDELESILLQNKFTYFRVDEKLQAMVEVTGNLKSIFPRATDSFTNLFCKR